MNFHSIHKQFKCFLQTQIYGSSLSLIYFRANFHVPFSTSQIEYRDTLGTGYQRLWGKNFYKRSKLKICLLFIVVWTRGRARGVFPMEGRPCSFAHQASQDGAVFTLTAWTLAHGPAWIYKVGFFSNRGKSPQTSFYCLSLGTFPILRSLRSTLLKKAIQEIQHKYKRQLDPPIYPAKGTLH